MNKQLFLILLLVLSQYYPIKAQDFLYPVARPSASLLLVAHQSPNGLTLWLWDPLTKLATLALPPQFSPLGVRLLPDKTGFSFMDNGFVRIKKWTKSQPITLDIVKQCNKRAPETLPLYEPIYDMGPLEWITSNAAYFCAVKRDRHALFEINAVGDLKNLVSSIACDCMFPQKVDQTLFYIERSDSEQGHTYEIIEMPYPNGTTSCAIAENYNDTLTYQQRVKTFIKNRSKSSDGVIANFGNRPLLWLMMVSATQGFVLEQPVAIEQTATVIPFWYHHLIKIDGTWHTHPLFSFSLPAGYILPASSNRLQESLLPLLPRYDSGHIYFVDCSEGQTLNLFDFEVISHKMCQKTMAHSGYHLFSPVFCDDRVYYGGNISPGSIELTAGDDQAWYIQLPFFE